MCAILEGDRDVYLNKEIRFYASIIYWFMILKLKICHQNSIKVKLRVGWNWGNSVEKIHSETYKANEIRKSVNCCNCHDGEPPWVLRTILSGLLIANELMTVIIRYNNWYLRSVYTGFISALQMLVFITNCCTAEFGGSH